MTRSEFETFKKEADEIDNRCACCRERVYECPSWIANNPIEEDPPGKSQGKARSDLR